MAWLDLGEELAEEFAVLEGKWRKHEAEIYDTGPALKSRKRRSDPVRWAWEYAGCKRRRREKRQVKVVARSPCPHCKGPVTRAQTFGPVPTYCSAKCSRNATWKRWHDRNREEYNATKREKDRLVRQARSV